MVLVEQWQASPKVAAGAFVDSAEDILPSGACSQGAGLKE
jgi:hypothetical protein